MPADAKDLDHEPPSGVLVGDSLPDRAWGAVTDVTGSVRDAFVDIGDRIAGVIVRPIEMGSVQPKADNEIERLRGATVSVFERPDGSRYSRIFPGPVHFQDVDGNWQRIDPTLVRVGSGFVPRSVGFEATLPTDPRSARVRIAKGGTAISFQLRSESTAAASVPGVDGRTISYVGIADGVDVRYSVHAKGLKEEIVLRSPRDRLTYDLGTEGLIPAMAEDGGIVFSDVSGTAMFRMPPGWMQEAPRVRPHPNAALACTTG